MKPLYSDKEINIIITDEPDIIVTIILGLIDDYEFVMHPRLVGHGPTLFAGLSKIVDLRLVIRAEFGSGAVAMRYAPRRQSFIKRGRMLRDPPRANELGA